MKTFKKTYLPDSIVYNGKVLTYNAAISAAMNANDTIPSVIAETLRKQGRAAVMVEVLSSKLKGRTDLYGNPYKPTRHIFTEESTK